MKNWIEVKLCKLLIFLLRRDYGADCRTSDLDDFPEMLGANKSKYVESSGRCASCRAKETIKFLEEHIEFKHS